MAFPVDALASNCVCKSTPLNCKVVALTSPDEPYATAFEFTIVPGEAPSNIFITDPLSLISLALLILYLWLFGPRDFPRESLL